MSRVRLGKSYARLPPGYRDSPLWWRVVAPSVRRSRRIRALIFDLPRSRVRSAALVHYYRDIVQDIGVANIERNLRAIDPDASVKVFEMEEFRGPDGAVEAVRQWHQSFPGLDLEMSEFVNPEGPDVLCIGRAAGGGAASGANVMLELLFRIRVIDGMAVELSLTNHRAEALEAVGLRE